MTATTSSSDPDPESFILESGLLEQWALEGRDCSIRCALRNAGFECRKLRRVLPHRLVIVDGDREPFDGVSPTKANKGSRA